MGETPNWPLPRTSPLEPPPLLKELRQNNPISKVTMWDGRQAWLVTRFADARRLLQDSRISTDATDPNFPSMSASRPTPTDRGGPARTGEPRHRELRRMVVDRFTMKAAEGWRPVAQRLIDEQLTVFLSGDQPGDLMSGFALPLTVRMICHVLGVPHGDMDSIVDRSRRVMSRKGAVGLPAADETQDYVDGLVTRAEREPGTGLISDLVRERRLVGEIGHTELVDLCAVLLVAGHATTSSAICAGALTLLEDGRERFIAIRGNPDLVASMVEEILRFHSIVTDGVVPRVAKQNIDLNGVTIRAGDAVLVSLDSANRDEQAFDNPDVLDIWRNSQRQLAFGYGAHRCLGQHLARLELCLAFTALADRVPTLRLAVPVEELRFRQDTVMPGVRELPLAW